MVAPTVRGATNADVDDDVRRGLRRVEDLTPGSRVQSRGDSDTLASTASRNEIRSGTRSQCRLLNSGCTWIRAWILQILELGL